MLYDQHSVFTVQAGGVAVFMKNIFAILLLFVPVGVAGHEIPADVTVRVFIRPAGNRLELLVRVHKILHPSRPPMHRAWDCVGSTEGIQRPPIPEGLPNCIGHIPEP